MTNTKDKLNEAKYFLGEMKRVSFDPDKFRYELTAFLAASRSITHIMKKEFSEKTGFNDWYTQKRGEMEKDSILKYLHKQRNISHHERPVLSYPIRVTDQISDSTGMQVVLMGTGSNVSLFSSCTDFPSIQPTTKIRYYFDDIPEKEKDVITICQEALDALEVIVIECEAKF